MAIPARTFARPPVPMAIATRPERAAAVPPQAYFVGSAIFHYLGPAFAVLLFARVAPLGVAWLRILTAALVFAAWRRPWRGRRGPGGVVGGGGLGPGDWLFFHPDGPPPPGAGAAGGVGAL